MRLLTICVFIIATVRSIAAEPFELKDGDKVVWLGSTLIEARAALGYWETALPRWPDRNITFRNLGWSGDNVYGEARLAFDITRPELGLKRMVDLTLAEKPTVIFICYGTNESFEGEAGLAKFEKGLEKLLDELKPAKARIVLFTPPPVENSSSLSSKVETELRNQQLSDYAELIRVVQKKRGLTLVDLFKEFGGKRNTTVGLTENGIHLTAYGYWLTAPTIMKELGLPKVTFEVTFSKDGECKATNAKCEVVKRDPLTVDVVLPSLPHPFAPVIPAALAFPEVPPPLVPVPTIKKDPFPKGVEVRIYAVTRDGQEIGKTYCNVKIDPHRLPLLPEYDLAEQLRQTIIEKNKLYFYRWRPQNETYLFGFRKHEQGQTPRRSLSSIH